MTNRLPMRNWSQTTSRLSTIGREIKATKGRAKSTYFKTRKALTRANDRQIAFRNQVQRVGTQKALTGQRSIYEPSPSKIARQKASDMKRKFFGGSIYE